MGYQIKLLILLVKQLETKRRHFRKNLISLTPEVVYHENQVACSTQKLLDISPEQEQLFQTTYKDPCFMQCLKMRLPKEYAGMTAVMT